MAYIACTEGGFTDRKLAKLFSVDQSQITLWKRKYPEFYTQIKKGKDEYNCMTAEKSMLKRIKGYKFKEITKEPVSPRDEEGKISGPPEMQVTKQVTKSIAPDVGAIAFFLKNRDPERWRDIKAVEIYGKDGGAIEIISQIPEPEETGSDDSDQD